VDDTTAELGVEGVRARPIALANGINLGVAEAGPDDGPLVVLLHGFPELWFDWRHQIPALAAAGFRVVAHDQRGYNRSSKPAGVAAYDLDRLAEDVVALGDALGRRTFAIVGHDWGASVGWWTAARHPERVERLAALAAPHPAVWKHAMQHDPVQRRLSWYVRAFRVPWLPELLMRARNFKALADAVRQTARPDAVSERDLEAYRAAWSQPGALTGMVNWYRALLAKDLPDPSGAPRVRVPTHVVWGAQERFAIRDLAERSRALCDDAQVTYIEDATHWVQHDAPERVNEILLGFLAGRERAR